MQNYQEEDVFESVEVEDGFWYKIDLSRYLSLISDKFETALIWLAIIVVAFSFIWCIVTSRCFLTFAFTCYKNPKQNLKILFWVLTCRNPGNKLLCNI